MRPSGNASLHQLSDSYVLKAAQFRPWLVMDEVLACASQPMVARAAHRHPNWAMLDLSRQAPLHVGASQLVDLRGLRGLLALVQLKCFITSVKAARDILVHGPCLEACALAKTSYRLRNGYHFSECFEMRFRAQDFRCIVHAQKAGK